MGMICFVLWGLTYNYGITNSSMTGSWKTCRFKIGQHPTGGPHPHKVIIQNTGE